MNKVLSIVNLCIAILYSSISVITYKRNVSAQWTREIKVNQIVSDTSFTANILDIDL